MSPDAIRKAANIGAHRLMRMYRVARVAAAVISRSRREMMKASCVIKNVLTVLVLAAIMVFIAGMDAWQYLLGII